MNVASNTPSSPVAIIMPTETAFLKQAGLAREALKTFLAVHKLGAPNVIRPALVDVVNFTVGFSYVCVFL